MPLAEDGFGLLAVEDIDPLALADFRCGKDHLDAFLTQQALQWHVKRLGFTSVVLHRDFDGVVGYFTLANDALPLSTSEQYELEPDVQLGAYPAVKLGRLAVNLALQGQGVGGQIMDLVHGEVMDAVSLSAARLVILDADNSQDDRVVEFYARLGYQKSLWAENQAKNHGGKPKGGRPATIKMIRDLLAEPPQLPIA